jgi:predicted nuclease with TOPRIM domain
MTDPFSLEDLCNLFESQLNEARRDRAELLCEVRELQEGHNKAWDRYTKLVAERSELRITLPFFLDQVEQMCHDFNTSMLDKSIAHIRDLLKETDRD